MDWVICALLHQENDPLNAIMRSSQFLLTSVKDSSYHHHVSIMMLNPSWKPVSLSELFFWEGSQLSTLRCYEGTEILEVAAVWARCEAYGVV